ncbi:hypothetical protein D9M70_435970 [compost metagenome]
MQELVLRRHRMPAPFTVQGPGTHVLAELVACANADCPAMMHGLLDRLLAIQAVIVRRAAGVETADVIDLATLNLVGHGLRRLLPNRCTHHCVRWCSFFFSTRSTIACSRLLARRQWSGWNLSVNQMMKRAHQRCCSRQACDDTDSQA